MKYSREGAGGANYDTVFKALGDEHRLQILKLLSTGKMNAGEILESMDIVQSTLSHHMKVLTDSGIVNAVRHGKWTIYEINGRTLAEAGHFLNGFLKENASGETGLTKPVKDRSESAPDSGQEDEAAEESFSRSGKDSAKAAAFEDFERSGGAQSAPSREDIRLGRAEQSTDDIMSDGVKPAADGALPEDTDPGRSRIFNSEEDKSAKNAGSVKDGQQTKTGEKKKEKKGKKGKKNRKK